VPPGFYWRTHEPLAWGIFLAFCLPPTMARFGHERGYIQHLPDWPVLRECPSGYQPLLKPIAAVAGDVVEVTADTVRINGTVVPHSASQAHDSRGRSLPHWPWGRYQLAPGELWVMSTYHPASWDSRYFGPIRAASVIATAAPAWVWPTTEAQQ
jgi:conjugative transfer signal peptidase TraF